MMNGDSRFVSGTAQSQLMTSLMEYGSIKSEPLQALLAATQSRSSWQHFDDASSPWQHALHHQPITADDITNKSFQPWRWHSELPFDGCTTTLNKTVGGLSPPTSTGQHSVNDQQQLRQQSHPHQSWAASMYGGPRLWPSTSYVDYDNGCYQRQPACSTYGSTGTNNGELPLTSSLSNYPLAESNKQSYPGIVEGGSTVENAIGSSRSPTTSAAMAAAARMQAVARYFNDRWYSSAATGYGPTHPCFDSGNGVSLNGGANRVPNGSSDDMPNILYASMAGRQSMASSSSISCLQQPGCPSAIGGLATCNSLLPPSDVNSASCYPFSSRWMWNGAPPTCAVNTNYALNNCSQLPAGTDIHNKQSSSNSDFYEDVKSDFRYLSSAVGGGLSGTPYAEISDGGVHGSDRKLSPETKKRRITDARVETRHPHSAANTMTSSSSTTATTAIQRATRPAATSVTSASGGGTRSAASACECPNCREADRIGGAAGEQLRRMGQHSCHVPGCGKVYSKTSHLKAHLHWHNAGSTVINNVNSGNAARESPSSSTCSKPNPVGDQRYDGQRHLSVNGGECRSQSDRLVTSSKRSRKKSRTETSSGKGDVPSNSSTSAFLGQAMSVCSSNASCETQRTVSNETVFDNKLNASQLGGRYDRVTGTGSSPTTDDDMKRSQRQLLKQSPDSIVRLRKQDSFECRRSAMLNCDDLLPVTSRTKSGGSSSLETGSNTCSNERLAVLTANG